MMLFKVIFYRDFIRGVKMENFTYAKARDFEILVHKESGFINYTKLCKDLTDDRKAFRNLFKYNPGFQALILSFIQENNPGAVTPRSETINFNVSYLVSQNVLINFNKDVKLNEMGTYGPKWMLDYIILHFKPEYYKLIHEALETIDDVLIIYKTKLFFY